MFGSQNTYGGYSNNSYGSASYYPPPSNPDPFWGNKQQHHHQNRINYRNQQDSAIVNDSLYGYGNNNNNAYPDQLVDGSINHIEAGISGLSIDSKSNDDFSGPPSFAASLGSRKTTTWASIASQPAKSQPKSLKSKMAASGLTGSTSKHLPPTVTMEAIAWDSKNGSIASGAASTAAPSGGKSAGSVPPPAVISPSAGVAPPPPPQILANSVSPIEDTPPISVPIIEKQQQQHPQPSPPQRPPLNQAVNNKNENTSWTSNGNSSSSGSISTSASSPRPSQAPILSGNPIPKPSYNNNNGNNYHHHSQQPHHHHHHNRGGSFVHEINENYNPNKYANQRNHNNNSNSYMKPIDNPPSLRVSARDIVPDSPPIGGSGASDDMSRSDVERLFDENDYNPKEFDLNPRNARFFIIKSYSEDDVHRSIKYSIWCSTEHGNKRLDTAFRQQEDKGPIYLFYSVNRSGHFCGVAQMMSPVDYNASSGVWAQDKWKGQFQVKWIYVKDVPNDELRHITLENNENKPVTNSRDTQEVPYEKGKKVLSIIHHFQHRTSIFDDFLHYEKKQEEEQRKPELSASPPPVNTYPMKLANSQYNSGMPPRENQLPFRGGNNYNNKHRSYSEYGRENDFRNDYRNEHRGDFRSDYRNDRMDRPRDGDYGRGAGGDHRDRERTLEHRNDYRGNNHVREGRDYREYRDHREPPPQFHRDQYHRDFHPPPPRDYTRERNDYRDHRSGGDFRDHRAERPDHREQRSWRN